MDKNLNELSALYMQNIAEQGPEEQQQRVTQIVKAIRYRARKEGVELSKAYNDYIGSVQATSTERQAVKEKLGLTGGAAHKEEVEHVEEGLTDLQRRRYLGRRPDESKERLKRANERKDKKAALAAMEKQYKGMKAGIYSSYEPEGDSIEESGVGYEAGKPAEKLGAVSGIPKSEQEAARERIKAKMAAKKAAKKVAESSYDPMEDPDFDHDEAEANRGVSGKNNPKGGKALGKKKKVVNKEDVSNWREEFIFEVDEAETDTEADKKITEKKVKNKVVINPPMKEAFDTIGGTILEVTECAHNIEGEECPIHGKKECPAIEEGIGMTMANAMGNPPVLSARMKVKQALIKREIDKNTKKNKMKKYSGKAKVEEQMGGESSPQMQNIQRRQLQLDRKKLEIRKKLMSQKQTSAADSTVASEEVEHINEMPFQVMGSPTGGKEKKIGKPVKSKKYADARAAELADTHKATGGQYRSQYVEDVEQVDEKLNLKKADMGDVVKDFYKSDAPQFKGKTKKERQKMAIAAKLSAERGER